MPKEKPFKTEFANYYKAQAEDLVLYGFVQGIQTIMPSVTVTRAVEIYKKHFNLDEDDYPLDCAIINYQTIKKKYFEAQRCCKD